MRCSLDDHRCESFSNINPGRSALDTEQVDSVADGSDAERCRGAAKPEIEQDSRTVLIVDCLMVGSELSDHVACHGLRSRRGNDQWACRCVGAGSLDLKGACAAVDVDADRPRRGEGLACSTVTTWLYRRPIGRELGDRTMHAHGPCSCRAQPPFNEVAELVGAQSQRPGSKWCHFVDKGELVACQRIWRRADSAGGYPRRKRLDVVVVKHVAEPSPG
jgi:hypothetical protein